MHASMEDFHLYLDVLTDDVPNPLNEREDDELMYFIENLQNIE